MTTEHPFEPQDELFRLQRPDEFIVPAPAFIADEPCRTPPFSRAPKVGYYCANQACPIREVVVSAAYLDEPPPATPPPAWCPNCRLPIRFETYYEQAYLIPADSDCQSKLLGKPAPDAPPGGA
jgi:hypothetical protein